MKLFMMLSAPAVLLGGRAVAQETRDDTPKDTALFSWHGYLVDAGSARDMTKDPETSTKKASEYSRESAMKAESQNAGYGILVEGKWLKFDKVGDMKAMQVLKNSKRDKGVMVSVSGRLDGDQIAVVSIEEEMPDNTVGGR